MAPKMQTDLRFPENEYFPPVPYKSGIALHHTVGGSARSTFEWWLKDHSNNGGRRMVGTAYIIGRDGRIHEVFDPAGWAFQFGLDWPPTRQLKFEQRFIGIELASEGGLIEANGNLYSFDRVSTRSAATRACPTVTPPNSRSHASHWVARSASASGRPARV